MLVDSVKYNAVTVTPATSEGEDELSLLEAEAEKHKELIASLEQKLEKNKRSLLDGFPTRSEGKYGVKVSKPSDNTGRLTQRLVAANTEAEVSGVMAEASQNLVSLRITAALGSPEDAQKAKAIIQRINKLIHRGSGKIMDLRSEQVMKSRSKRAEQERKDKKAEKIKTQLRQKQKMRHSREGWYLRECALNRLQDDFDDIFRDGMAASSEAAIAAQADAMAAVEVAAEAACPGDASVDVGGGGEVASADAGAAAAPSLDISV